MENEVAKCELCGEPMPAGEEMFNYHGYSGPCPKPPLPSPPTPLELIADELRSAFNAVVKDNHRVCFREDEATYDKCPTIYALLQGDL